MAIIFGTTDARRMARDAPKILRVSVRGYIRIANEHSRKNCNCAIILGLPMLWNTGPVVAPIDLIAPQIDNTCIA